MFYMSSLLMFYYEENFVRTEQFARFTNTLKVSYIYQDNLFHDLLVLQGSQTIVQHVYLILNIILIITCI